MGTVLDWGNPLHKPFPLFLLGFGITIAYIPGILGASISTGWLFLFIVSPVLFLYCEFKLGLGFIFILYVLTSLFWTTPLNIGIFYALQYISLEIIFIVGQNINDIKPVFKGLAFGLVISSIVAISQHFGYHEIYTLNNDDAGIFINPNIFSEVSAVILVGLIVLRLWWYIPATLTGLLLVHSRTAYVALAVSVGIWGWNLNKKATIIVLFGIFSLFIYLYWDNFSISSIQERFSIWTDTIQGLRIFGNGVGSYEPMFPYYATHINTELMRPKYAHNDFLNLVFEFGVGSILALMVLWNVFKIKRKEVVILYAIFMVSLFTYPLHVPVEAFIALMVAGYISSYSTCNGNFGNCSRPILFKGCKNSKFGRFKYS